MRILIAILYSIILVPENLLKHFLKAFSGGMKEKV